MPPIALLYVGLTKNNLITNYRVDYIFFILLIASLFASIFFLFGREIHENHVALTFPLIINAYGLSLFTQKYNFDILVRIYSVYHMLLFGFVLFIVIAVVYKSITTTDL